MQTTIIKNTRLLCLPVKSSSKHTLITTMFHQYCILKGGKDGKEGVKLTRWTPFTLSFYARLYNKFSSILYTLFYIISAIVYCFNLANTRKYIFRLFSYILRKLSRSTFFLSDRTFLLFYTLLTQCAKASRNLQQKPMLCTRATTCRG